MTTLSPEKEAEALTAMKSQRDAECARANSLAAFIRETGQAARYYEWEGTLSAPPPPVPTEEGGDYKPTLIAFDDPPRIEYINADAPSISRRVDERFDLLLDMDTREPFGFRLYGKWSPSTQAPQDVAGLVEACQPFIDDFDWIDASPHPCPDDAPVCADDYSRSIRYRDIRRLRAALSALRPSPISHESKALELAAADDNREALVALTDPGTCEGDDSGHILAFLHGLHSHLPEDERPTSWMQFSDDQRDRIKSAWRSMAAAFQSRQEGKQP